MHWARQSHSHFGCPASDQGAPGFHLIRIWLRRSSCLPRIELSSVLTSYAEQGFLTQLTPEMIVLSDDDEIAIHIERDRLQAVRKVGTSGSFSTFPISLKILTSANCFSALGERVQHSDLNWSGRRLPWKPWFLPRALSRPSENIFIAMPRSQSIGKHSKLELEEAEYHSRSKFPKKSH